MGSNLSRKCTVLGLAALVGLALVGGPAAEGAVYGVPTNLAADGQTTAGSADPPGWFVLERTNSGSTNGDVVKQIRFFIQVTGSTLDVRVFDAGLSGARDLGNPATMRYRLLNPGGASLGALTIGADAAGLTENRLARFACQDAAAPAFRVPNAALGATHRIWGAGSGNCAALPPGLYVFEATVQGTASTEGRNAFGIEVVDASGNPYEVYTIASDDNTITPAAATDTAMVVGAVAGDRPEANVSGSVVFYPFVDRGCSVEPANFDLDANTAEGNGSTATLIDLAGAASSIARSNNNDEAYSTVIVEPTGTANTTALNYGMFTLRTALDDWATPQNHVDWRVSDWRGSTAGTYSRLPVSAVRMFLPRGYSACSAAGCTMVAPGQPVLRANAEYVSGEDPPLPGGATTRMALTASVVNESLAPVTNVQITIPIATGATYVAGSQAAYLDGVAATCTDGSAVGYRRCTFATVAAGQAATLQFHVDYQPLVSGVNNLSGAPTAASPPANTTVWAQYASPFASTETLGPLCQIAVNAAPTVDMTVQTHTDNPDPVTAGTNLSYTIAVRNAGANAATNPSFEATLPAGTTFVSMTSAGGWTCVTPAVGSGGTVRCFAASLAATTTVGPFTLVASVGSDVAGGTVLTSTVTVSSGGTETNSSNDASSVTTTVVTPGAQANLGVTKADAPDPVTPGRDITYLLTVTNTGPATAVNPSIADTVPVNTTFQSLSVAPGWSCTTPVVGGTGNIACTATSLASGSSAVFRLIARVGSGVSAGTTISNTAQVTSAVTDPIPGNNSVTATTSVVAASIDCPTPGQDGSGGTLSGIINTYYPGTLSVSAGSTTLLLGASRGSTTPIAAGDLLLVVQMQDADINATNTDAYGDGVGGDGEARGATALNSAGLYEYVLATNAVGTGGGTLAISSGLLNSYRASTDVIPLVSLDRVGGFFSTTAEATTGSPHGLAVGATVTIAGVTNDADYNGTYTITAVPSATEFRYTAGGFLAASAAGAPTATYATQPSRTFQVVRVPQYTDATLGSTVTGAYWDGSTGGILAFDVENDLALGNATVDLTGRGFRGGGAQQRGGGAGGSATAYVSPSTQDYHASKGEGIAGTPRYIYSQETTSVVDTGAEGYPNGSFGRGAPGNAGGGGTDSNPSANDQNAGGGGGGNGGIGGRGGNSWNANAQVGGFGGDAVAASTSRLILGGGGGAGSRNNSAGDQSSGSAGGGIVLIRAGELTGTGTIRSNGASANTADTTPDNDAGGGGGAGGTIVVLAPDGLGTLTAEAVGGRGSDAWPTIVAQDYPGERHGPGGGGGGGVVILSGTPTSVSVAGGSAGTTTLNPELYGASDGSVGVVLTDLAATQIPGIDALCDLEPGIVDLSVTVSGPSGAVEACGNAVYTYAVSNIGPDDAIDAVVTFPVGDNVTFQSLDVAEGWSCTTPAVGGTGDVICTRPLFAVGTESTFTLTLRVDCGTAVGAVIESGATVTSGSTETYLPNNDAVTTNLVGPPIVLLTRAVIRGVRVDPRGRVAFATGWQKSSAAFDVYATDDARGLEGLRLLTHAPLRAPVPDSFTPIVYEVDTRRIRERFIVIEETERGGLKRRMGPFAVGDARLAAILDRVERRLARSGATEMDVSAPGAARVLGPRAQRRFGLSSDDRRARKHWRRGHSRKGRREAVSGINLAVAGAGVVRVPRGELDAAGLPSGVPLRRVVLWNQGQRWPTTVSMTEDGEEALIFAARGGATSYSTQSVFVATWSGRPPRPSVPLSREGDALRAGWWRIDPTLIFLPSAPRGTDPWLWEMLAEGWGPWPYDWWDPAAGDFDLPGLVADPAQPTAVRMRLQGMSSNEHVVEVWINGQSLGTLSWQGATAAYFEGVATGLMPMGNRVAVMYHTTTGDPDGYAYVDYLELQVSIPGPMLTAQASPLDARLPGLAKTQYLIVTHPLFMAQAQRVASAKRGQGFRTAVVDVEAAYDAFSGGVVEAAAVGETIRRAARGGHLRHVLLIGDDSLDPDDRSGYGSMTFMPSLFGWDGVYGRVPSENAYADVDGDSLPDVSIGRLPVQTVEEADVLVAKIVQQQALLRGKAGRHVFAVDNQGAGDIDFRAEANAVAASLPDGVVARWADLADGVAAARSSLAQGLLSGAAFVHYFGHAGPDAWADEALLTMDDASTLPSTPTVLLTWTCQAQMFQYLFGQSVNEALLLKPDGGALAAFGPAGIGDAPLQAALYGRLYDELAAGDVTLGEAIRRAKRAALTGDPRVAPVVEGWNLIGDPALRVPSLLALPE